MSWDKVFDKVRKGTRFAQDINWWYKTGKYLYDKGKDFYDWYSSGPHLREAFEKPIDFGINSVIMD